MGEAKGWGVQVLKPRPMGSFVFEFFGEILTAPEMHKRVLSALRTCKQTYIQNVVLDTDPKLDDSQALCLDGTFRGNVERFINHRC
jgi:SET domain-containing protein